MEEEGEEEDCARVIARSGAPFVKRVMERVMEEDIIG